MLKMSLDRAYRILGLEESSSASLADEDVGVAFYTARTSVPQDSLRDALSRIA